MYNDLVAQIEQGYAEDRLAADVDTGQKWVARLREWEGDAQNFYGEWHTMTDATRANVTQETIRRLGLTWGGLADLLPVLDNGR